MYFPWIWIYHNKQLQTLLLKLSVANDVSLLSLNQKEHDKVSW